MFKQQHNLFNMIRLMKNKSFLFIFIKIYVIINNRDSVREDASILW